MKKYLLLFFSIALFISCGNKKKDKSDTYNVINTIIGYHKILINKGAEILPNGKDSVKYEDFTIIPKTTKLLKTQEKDSKLYFSLKGLSSQNTIFNKFMNEKDSSFVNKQINKNLPSDLNPADLGYNHIPNYVEYQSYTQANQIRNKYKKDLIFFDNPVFNKKRDRSVACYIYLKKHYQITKIVSLQKDSKNGNWKIDTQYGFVTKHIPKNKDWENPSGFYAIYVGSLSR